MAKSPHHTQMAETLIGRGMRVSEILKLLIHLEDVEPQETAERVYREDSETFRPPGK